MDRDREILGPAGHAAGSGRASRYRLSTRSIIWSEAGVEYIGDWVLDDEPVTLKTAH